MIAAAPSSAELLSSRVAGLLRHDPAAPLWPDRDRMGSLGAAGELVGLALAFEKAASLFDRHESGRRLVSRRVFVVGDESGIDDAVLEAAAFAGRLIVSRIAFVIAAEPGSDSLARRFAERGFRVEEAVGGRGVESAVARFRLETERPTLIVVDGRSLSGGAASHGLVPAAGAALRAAWDARFRDRARAEPRVSADLLRFESRLLTDGADAMDASEFVATDGGAAVRSAAESIAQRFPFFVDVDSIAAGESPELVAEVALGLAVGKTRPLAVLPPGAAASPRVAGAIRASVERDLPVIWVAREPESSLTDAARDLPFATPSDAVEVASAFQIALRRRTEPTLVAVPDRLLPARAAAAESDLDAGARLVSTAAAAASVSLVARGPDALRRAFTVEAHLATWGVRARVVSLVDATRVRSLGRERRERLLGGGATLPLLDVTESGDRPLEATVQLAASLSRAASAKGADPRSEPKHDRFALVERSLRAAATRPPGPSGALPRPLAHSA